MKVTKDINRIAVPSKSLERILIYLKDERADYENNGKPKNHIYKDIEVIQNELKINK